MPTEIKYTFVPYLGPSSLVVFTKIPGLVPCKQRLLQTAPLLEHEVISLAKAFLVDTLRTARLATNQTVFLASDPEVTPETLQTFLADMPAPVTREQLKTFSYVGQLQVSFGKRLDEAIRYAFLQKKQSVVVIGSDSPLLSPETIKRALEAVEAGYFVLGPTPHGGLYLLGVPKDHLPYYSLAEVFEKNEVTELNAFIENILRVQGEFLVLELGFDVDIKDDLVTLQALLPAVDYTQRRQKELSPSRIPHSVAFGHAPSTERVMQAFHLQMKPTKNNREVILFRLPEHRVASDQ